MSHSFEWEDDRPSKELDDIYCPDNDQFIYVNYNSDYSGDASISVPHSTWTQIVETIEYQPQVNDMPGDRVRFKLPADLLAKFAREATIREAIAALEGMV